MQQRNDRPIQEDEDVLSTQWRSCQQNQSFLTLLFLSPLGWHTLSSHASAEACLTGWPNVQPQGRDLRDTIRLT